MYNNTNSSAANTALIDINDKERLKRLTIDDLYNDAEARDIDEAMDMVENWIDTHKDGENSYAYMKFKHDYLVKFCDLPLSTKERHAITAAKIAARKAKKAEAEAIKAENNIE